MVRWLAWLGASWAGPLTLGLGYALLAMLSLAYTSGANQIATVWPPSGLLLASLLVVPRQHLWRFAVAAGPASMVANIAAGASPVLASGFTAANVIEALIAALLLRRRLANRVALMSPAGLTRFTLATFVAALASAAIAALVAGSLTTNFFMSWFGTVWLGMLVIAPLLLVLLRAGTSSRIDPAPSRPGDLTGVGLLTALLATATFSQNDYPLLFLPIVGVLVAVMRCGTAGGILSIIIVTIIGSVGVSNGHGPILLVRGGYDERSLFFQFYLLTLFVAALPMAALLARRDELRTELAERIRLLSLAEKAAHIGHWRVDTGRQAIYWSPEVFHIHGMPVGHPPTIEEAIDSYHADDRARVSAIVGQALVDGAPFAFAARIVRADGSVRHVRSRGERDLSSDDAAIGLFGIIQDVTEQVESERILKDARDSAERAAEQARWLAETDVLTGLANRRRIVQQLTEAIARAEAGQGTVSVALFDIDHFKSVNDGFGHAIGDQVLRRVATAAADALRSSDMIGRYGGEEFVLVLPDARADVAMRIAERVREAVVNSIHGADEPTVTVSLGVAAFASGVSVDAILDRADHALYEAKRDGRNRLRLAA